MLLFFYNQSLHQNCISKLNILRNFSNSKYSNLFSGKFCFSCVVVANKRYIHSDMLEKNSFSIITFIAGRITC